MGHGERPIAVSAATPAELSQAYASSLRIEAGQEHERICRSAFERYIERSHLNAEIAALGLDSATLLLGAPHGDVGQFQPQRDGSGAARARGLNSRRVYEAAFGLAPEERLTQALLGPFTARRDPALAEIPYL